MKLLNKIGYWSYLLPGLLLLVVVILVPFGVGIYTSFTNWSGVGPREWIGLDNYVRLVNDDLFIGSFRNSVFMIIALVLVPTALGLLIAAVLFDYLGRRFGRTVIQTLRTLLYLPQIIPVVIAGIVWGWILQPNGALNLLLGVIGLEGFQQNWLGQPGSALGSLMLMLVWVQIGYPVVVFISALERVDPELYEAAELDGAGFFRRFRAISIPQIRPETFVITLTATVAALKVFGPVYALTSGGPGNATYVPSYLSYQTFFQRLQVGYGSAIAVVLALVVLIVACLILWWQRADEKREM